MISVENESILKMWLRVLKLGILSRSPTSPLRPYLQILPYPQSTSSPDIWNPEPPIEVRSLEFSCDMLTGGCKSNTICTYMQYTFDEVVFCFKILTHHIFIKINYESLRVEGSSNHFALLNIFPISWNNQPPQLNIKFSCNQTRPISSRPNFNFPFA